jgi:hypothetical protein
VVTKVTSTFMVAVVLSFNKVCLVNEVTNASVINIGKLRLPAFLRMPLLLEHTTVGSFCLHIQLDEGRLFNAKSRITDERK